jgi:hypothetical protein
LNFQHRHRPKRQGRIGEGSEKGNVYGVWFAGTTYEEKLVELGLVTLEVGGARQTCYRFI